MKIDLDRGPGFFVVLLCLLCHWVFAERSLAASSLKAVDGVISLQGWDPEANPLVQVQGKARFHWQEFIVSNPGETSRAELIPIPASWHKAGPYPLYGYATYAFDLVSDQERALALDFGLISLSHRIYVNGQLIRSNGHPASTLDLFERASSNKVLFSFIVLKGLTRIEIEVANYDYMMAGLSKPIFLGTPEAVQSHRLYPMFAAFTLFGAYLVVGLYHFGLYSLRRRDRSALYFGLFCLASLPSILVNNEVNTLDLLGAISVPVAIFLAASLALAMSFLGFFLSYLYDDRLPRLASLVLMGLYALFGLSSLLGMKIFLGMLVLMVTVGLAAGVIFISSILRALRKRKQGAGLMLISICTVLLISMHDYANFSGWIESIPLSAVGSLAFLMIQSYLLSARFSRAFTQVEISERHIRQVNENLEHLAEEKSREVRSILSHIQLGIFSIEAENFRVHKDHSLHMQEIFEMPDIAGLNAAELLFSHSQLSSDERSQATSALSAMLGEDALAFQLNAECLPHELHHMGPSGQQKLLELGWHPIVNDAGCTEKILVTVRDVTKIRALEEDAQDKKEELQFISELLNISAEAFRRFMQNANDFIQENRKLVNSRSIHFKDVEVLKLLFINMHTMKGAARSLYLKKMTKVFHDVEQYYAHLQNNQDAHWDVDRMNLDLDEAEAILRTYQDINHGKLGRKKSDERVIEIPETRLQQLYEQFLQHAQDFAQSLQSFFLQQLFTPVKQILTELCECTGTLAKDLKKEKPLIILETEDLCINSTGDSLFRKIFVHLLRNSMDHGIESPEDRLQHKKAPQGTIHITAQRRNGDVKLVYRDDGRGLDLAKIRSIALEKQLIQSDDELSSVQVGELIFYPGLSTANQLNDVSGRGVGMDAVRNYIEKAGGSIKLHLHEASPSTRGCSPFHFEISLPLQLFAVIEINHSRQ